MLSLRWNFNKNRFETFIDGVIAIIITLLAFQITLPAQITEFTNDSLVSVITNLFPQITVFLITFLTIGVFYITQHTIMVHVKKLDNTLIWYNVLFLLFMSLIPVTASLLTKFITLPLAILVYIANLVMVYISLYLVWRHASSDYELIDQQVQLSLISYLKARILVAPLLYILAVVTSFISIYLSFLIMVIVPIIYIQNGVLDTMLIKYFKLNYDYKTRQPKKS
jgi:uncharacterized membrane protein